MSGQDRHFHESWHRLAGQIVSLRSSVRVTRQIFRGSRWYVLHDAFSNSFHRLRPAAYDFVSRLGRGRTVNEVWEAALAANPEQAPGQVDVVELLAQLYHANLLHSDITPDCAKLFQRQQKKKQRILKANLANILFFRIPLFDPSWLLDRSSRLIRLLFGPAGALLWLAAVGFGAMAAAENAAALVSRGEGILAPSNLFLLYAATALVKTLHEFGHAFAVRRFGGEVHKMGVMFLLFSPLPYMDASAAWAFRSKWHRALVGSAGMIFEIFLAACAALIWARTGPGVIHSLAYNMMFAASVSTLVFNLNPLLRYDGYYILTDLLGYPNLHQNSRRQLTYLVERHAFGRRDGESPATTPREAWWYAIFGILSGIYRFFVFAAILLFLGDQFVLAGLLIALVGAVLWIGVPGWKLLRYLGSGPQLERTRGRAVGVAAGAALAAFAFLQFCPFPRSFHSPGILEAVTHAFAINASPGYVRTLAAGPGTRVAPGDSLVILENPELALEVEETRAALSEARVRHQKAMQEAQADMAPLESRLDYLAKRLERLEKEERGLVLRAQTPGIWVAPGLEDRLGMWVGRGTSLGQVIDDARFRFVSVVPQEDASAIFEGRIRESEVRLAGQASEGIKVLRYAAIPMEQSTLPSASLGHSGGGEIALAQGDAEGMTTAEPFYEVRAEVEAGDGAALYHGRSGRIRFVLPAAPLLPQGWRRLRQTLQKRYQI